MKVAATGDRDKGGGGKEKRGVRRKKKEEEEEERRRGEMKEKERCQAGGERGGWAARVE